MDLHREAAAHGGPGWHDPPGRTKEIRDDGRETMRSVHLCNLANVAYGYCNLLREAGHDVALGCHDLKHLMSQPEWYDLELEARDFPDEGDFFNNTADLSDYRRPEWYRWSGFQQEHFRDLPRSAGEDDGEETLDREPPLVRWYERLLAWAGIEETGPQSEPDPPLTPVNDLTPERFEWLIQKSREMGPDCELSHEMLHTYRPHAWWAREMADGADVVFSYVLAPIYSMLMGGKPYVSIEIGTMRETPFERDLDSQSWTANSGTGRLLALAYRLSPHVLITNPDVVQRTEELGIESYAFCPHPLDEDLYRAESAEEFRAQLLQEHRVDHLLFAPARQNWEIKRNDRYLKAFARLVREDGVNAALIIPGWGQEVERSKKLCRRLGIERWVQWIAPQSERALVKYYAASDFVLDQFDLGVFGLTTPKALACGAVVVTSYDPALHEWCFDEHPPLLAATTSGEIHRILADLCSRPERRAEIRVAARRWVLEHHSKRRVRSILEDAMMIARERHTLTA